MKSSLVIAIFKIVILIKLVSADCENGASYSHPLFWEAYLVCDHGQLIEMWCPPTLRYNIDLRVCDFPDRVLVDTAIEGESKGPIHIQTLLTHFCT